jgi:hypothetical protein
MRRGVSGLGVGRELLAVGYWLADGQTSAASSQKLTATSQKLYLKDV